MPSGIYKRKPRGQEQSEMIDQKFGRLTVLSYCVETSKQHSFDYYLCRCNCDNKRVVSGNNLRCKRTRSCGCLHREIVSELCKQMDHRGENHPRHYHGFDIGREKFRETVRVRDKVCQYNDGSECKGRLEVHHLDGDHDNNDPKNSSLLCKKHHTIVTINNNVWRPYRKL